MTTSSKMKFQGAIQGFSKAPNYIVEGKHFNTYQEAFNEALKLSKKENKRVYICTPVSVIEQITHVTQLIEL